MATLAPIPRRASAHSFGGTTKHTMRAFPCSQCNASFNRAAHLRRHLTAHNGERPYQCEFCPLSSSRKDVIVRHTRNFHPEATSTGVQGTSPNMHSAIQRENQRNTLSPNLDNSHTQDSCEADRIQSHVQSALDTTTPFRKPLQPLSSLSNGEAGALESNTPDFGDLDLAGTDFTFLNEMILPDDHMHDLLPDPPPSWPVFESDTVMELPLTQPQASVDLSQTRLRTHSSPSGSDGKQTELLFQVEDHQYSAAQANLDRVERSQKPTDFRLPSKYAMGRFLKAFFEHMAPHLPIIHRPTFDVASVPSPLLLSIMASGAIYSGEQEIATEMYFAGLQLISVSEDHSLPLAEMEETTFQLWELQSHILLSYFGIYGHSGQLRRKALHVFARTTGLAQEAIEELRMKDYPHYEDWVRQETISRCIASVHILGAVLNSSSDRLFHLPDYSTKILLPSSTDYWLKDDQNWERPPPVLYAADIMGPIMAGVKPTVQASDYALLTIISCALDRICNFETLTRHACTDLYAQFVSKTAGQLDTLDEIWKEQNDGRAANGSLPTPIEQCTRSLLDSAIYHLHGSSQLASVMRLLQSPNLLDDPDELKRISQAPQSKTLKKALLRAADSLRKDCRLGLRYMQRVAPHRFAPLSATAVSEGGLLLYWYLGFKSLNTSAAEIDALLEEINSEVKSLQITRSSQSTILPLVTSAALLQETSVWKWPPTVTANLRALVAKIECLSAA